MSRSRRNVLNLAISERAADDFAKDDVLPVEEIATGGRTVSLGPYWDMESTQASESHLIITAFYFQFVGTSSTDAHVVQTSTSGIAEFTVLRDGSSQLEQRRMSVY